MDTSFRAGPPPQPEKRSPAHRLQFWFGLAVLAGLLGVFAASAFGLLGAPRLHRHASPQERVAWENGGRARAEQEARSRPWSEGLLRFGIGAVLFGLLVLWRVARTQRGSAAGGAVLRTPSSGSVAPPASPTHSQRGQNTSSSTGLTAG